MSISIPLTEDDIGKTLRITADIFTPNNDSKLQLLHNGGYDAVDVLKNNSFQETVISRVITNPDNVEFFVNTLGEQDCYVDNIRITAQ